MNENDLSALQEGNQLCLNFGCDGKREVQKLHSPGTPVTGGEDTVGNKEKNSKFSYEVRRRASERMREYNKNRVTSWNKGLKKPFQKCSVDGCERKVAAKGYCLTHYERFQRWGNAFPEKPIDTNFKERSGGKNSNWKGGQVQHKDGRVLIYSPDHPFPNFDGIYVYRYRLVMEKHLGRFLQPDEIVHHKNRNTSDDRIENLEIMPQSLHAKQHSMKYESKTILDAVTKHGSRIKAAEMLGCNIKTIHYYMKIIRRGA